PPLAPLDFPTNLTLVASGLDGTVELTVTALDATGAQAGRGAVSVKLNAKELFSASVKVGAASTCGDGKPTPAGAPPEVCFMRQSNLKLGGGDANRGNIGNGVTFVNFDGNGGPDIL